MAPSLFTLLSLGSLLVSSVSAQTWTACNPLERDGCPSMPALSTNATFNWTDAQMADDKIWNTTVGPIKWNEKGADFTVGGRGDSPTIQSKFYIFFGVVSIVMRAAPGQGIVSSMVLQSDDLDEIDWEFIGGNTTHVQTNYFGKGDTTTYDRDIWHPVSNPQSEFHNYTVHWTKDQMDFYINDDIIRTVKDGESQYPYPQTPMNIRLGIWAGGDKENNAQGTVDWAGGETDFRSGPYTMSIASVYAKDYGTGKEYQYSDRSGTWESIKSVEGESYAVQRMREPKGISGHWNAMPKGARVGIIAGALAGLALAIIAIGFCCIVQRRRGRREHRLLQEKYQQEQANRAYWKERVDYSHQVVRR